MIVKIDGEIEITKECPSDKNEIEFTIEEAKQIVAKNPESCNFNYSILSGLGYLKHYPDEVISIWLKTLYEREKEEVEGTISNELLWLKGSETDICAENHTDNIRKLQKYKNILDSLIQSMDENINGKK